MISENVLLYTFDSVFVHRFLELLVAMVVAASPEYWGAPPPRILIRSTTREGGGSLE